MPKKPAPARLRLSVAETENTITLGATAWDGNFRDRLNYDRLNVLNQAINAWRSNPIARRIIDITTEFVLGDGFSFTAPAQVLEPLRSFWRHPLNDLDGQIPEWADEAWRTGDLFLLLSQDPGGGVYVRALPSESISSMQTAENDYRQEKFYLRSALDPAPYPAFNASEPLPAEGSCVLHFPLNRAVGANFGESDLAPILHWIHLYRQFLEDRARLNYFRQVFSFVLQRPFPSMAEKDAYLRSFTHRFPKESGSILALDPEESLQVINPNLASSEAQEDGLALKRMIATGAGLPLHYLAEPESSTRTTAESAGTPTFKRFKRRQQYLVNVVQTLLETVLVLQSRVAPESQLPHLDPGDIRVLASDITERDNASLSISVQRIVTAFAPLYNARLIPPSEFLRLVYRFVAEVPPDSSPAFSPINLRGTRFPPAEPPETS